MYSSEGFTHPDYDSEYMMIPSEFDPRSTPSTAPRSTRSSRPPASPDGAGHPLGLRELLEELAPSAADVITDFALRFPTSVFIGMLGVPVDDLDTLISWVHQSQHTSHARTPTPDP